MGDNNMIGGNGASTSGAPYVPLYRFNDTGNPNGGNSLTQDLNIYYETGDMAWLLTSTALVLLMIPGVGFFYSGLARRKSALSLLWLSVAAIAVTQVQWFIWGYSLAFSHSAGPFIGDLANGGFRNVLGYPSVGSPTIPDLLYAVYESMFASITVALVIGAAAERGKMAPVLLFCFIWSTLVYDVIAAWHWNPAGWANKLGSLDFAGGTPVHVTSGFAALAFSYVLGKRAGHGTQALNYRPHNVSHIVLGTVLMYVGWLGFNGGSALSANLRAVMAIVVTNISASVGGLTWTLVDYRLEGRFSAVGFCSGVIAGLVAITPGSGYVPPWAAVVYGLCAGVACNYATQIKYWLQADDALDIFAVHGVGGLVGCVLTGLFASDYIAHLDGTTVIAGGFVNRNYRQLALQLAATSAGAAWSFCVTLLILIAISFLGRLVPAFRLRVSREEEAEGIDHVELGEYAYDYVELVREVKSRQIGLEYEDEEREQVHSQASMLQPEKGMSSYPMHPMQQQQRQPQYPYQQQQRQPLSSPWEVGQAR